MLLLLKASVCILVALVAKAQNSYEECTNMHCAGAAKVQWPEGFGEDKDADLKAIAAGGEIKDAIACACNNCDAFQQLYMWAGNMDGSACKVAGAEGGQDPSKAGMGGATMSCYMDYGALLKAILIPIFAPRGQLFDEHSMCSMMRLQTKMPRGCDEAKSREECALVAGCEFKDEGEEKKCETNGMLNFRWMTGHHFEKGSVWDDMLTQYEQCAVLLQNDCDDKEGCSWNEEEAKCDGGSGAMQAMCNQEDGVSLHTKDQACQKLNVSDCDGECAPDDDETKCELSMDVFGPMMFGNSKLMEAFSRSEQCGGDACQEPCMSWTLGCSERTPGLEAFNANFTKSLASKATDCQTSCDHSYCEWSTEKNECYMDSDSAMRDFCGANLPPRRCTKIRKSVADKLKARRCD